MADPTFAKATTEVLMREAMDLVERPARRPLKPSDRRSPFFQMPFFRTNFWRAAGATAAVAGIGRRPHRLAAASQDSVTRSRPARAGRRRASPGSTLDRPEALNALNRELTAALEQTLERVAARTICACC